MKKKISSCISGLLSEVKNDRFLFCMRQCSTGTLEMFSESLTASAMRSFTYFFFRIMKFLHCGIQLKGEYLSLTETSMTENVREVRSFMIQSQMKVSSLVSVQESIHSS